jgi:hypothetical protein
MNYRRWNAADNRKEGKNKKMTAAKKPAARRKKGPRLVSLQEFWTPQRIARARRDWPPPPSLTPERIEEFRRIVRESAKRRAAGGK